MGTSADWNYKQTESHVRHSYILQLCCKSETKTHRYLHNQQKRTCRISPQSAEILFIFYRGFLNDYNVMDYFTNIVWSFYNYFWPPPPPPPPPPREVIFGRKPLDGGVGLAHHWAIKVGETWYEIEGASVKEKGSSNTIAASDGQASKCGAKPCKVLH